MHTYTKGPVAKDHDEEVDEVTEEHVGINICSYSVHRVQKIFEEVAEWFHVAGNAEGKKRKKKGHLVIMY